MRLLLIWLPVFFTCPAFSQVNLNRGLLAYFPFTGNAADASGNKNNGVVFNATLTADKNGKSNSAYHFNGYNAFVEISNSPALQPGHQISMCAQIRITGFYRGQCFGNCVIMKGNEEYVPSNFLLRYADIANGCSPLADIKKEQIFGGSNIYSAIAPKPLTPGHWYSLVCTYDGSNFRLYVDCVLQNTSATIRNLSFNNADPLMLGRTLFDGYPYFLNGDIDEVRIYNRALSAEEVKAYSGCPAKKEIKDSTSKKEIDLVSFKAIPSPDNKFIRLNWSVVNEYAGSYIIERNSRGNADYKIITTQAMRQNPGINTYSFYDNDVIPGIVYEYEIHYLKGDKLHTVNRKMKVKAQVGYSGKF